MTTAFKTLLHRSLAALTLAAGAVLAHAQAPVGAATPAFQVRVVGEPGTAPALILIPGLASPASVWDGLLPELCARRQCHVLQLAGFAGLPKVEGPLLAQVQQQLGDYIRAQRLERPVVAGHSLGGFLALKLAAQPDSPLGGAVVVDALPALGAMRDPRLGGEALRQMAAQMRTQMEGLDEPTYQAGQRASLARMMADPVRHQALVDACLRSDRATVTGAMAEMMGEDLRPQLPQIRVPVLVLGSWAAYKPFATEAAVEAAYRLQYQGLSTLTLKMAPDGLHFLMLDQPAWTLAQMLAFQP